MPKQGRPTASDIEQFIQRVVWLEETQRWRLLNFAFRFITILGNGHLNNLPEKLINFNFDFYCLARLLSVLPFQLLLGL